MDKQDRKIVEDAKAHGGTMGTKGRDLLELIDRLDKQLTEVKEAGGPFEEFVVHMEYVRHPIDSEVLCGTRLSHYRADRDFQEITVENIRRLAQLLREVKDGKH